MYFIVSLCIENFSLNFYLLFLLNRSFFFKKKYKYLLTFYNSPFHFKLSKTNLYVKNFNLKLYMHN